jgi:hypothetical protein
MQYKGPQSLPMIDMVLAVRWALEELNISVPWHDDGPLCELDVPRSGALLRIRREFSAETDRLFVTTILKVPIAHSDTVRISATLELGNAANDEETFISAAGFLACSEVLEIRPDEVTPMFIGRLLDRTTKQILSLAESVGVIEKS